MSSLVRVLVAAEVADLAALPADDLMVVVEDFLPVTLLDTAEPMLAAMLPVTAVKMAPKIFPPSPLPFLGFFASSTSV